MFSVIGTILIPCVVSQALALQGEGVVPLPTHNSPSLRLITVCVKTTEL